MTNKNSSSIRLPKGFLENRYKSNKMTFKAKLQEVKRYRAGGNDGISLMLWSEDDHRVVINYLLETVPEPEVALILHMDTDSDDGMLYLGTDFVITIAKSTDGHGYQLVAIDEDDEF